ncbi:hypothetical protein DKX38_006299 [Salix brachista]|uniref:40S ribosomal protein S25 n=1 Tax=Salix brachista TaxID=2182728 RepID=A0A5N5N243_9ROSI|nr:hypothetical protein DKX38_006299 [Salix brachista]
MAPKKEKAPPPSSKPAKSGGGKQKKKKWSKGKQKEKVNNMVLFDQATYDKLLSEAPKYKLITPSVLSDRMRLDVVFRVYDINPDYCCSSRSEVSDLLRAVSILGNTKFLVFGRNFWRILISGSLARKAIRELMARGSIRMVSSHASQQIYTRATNT